MATASEPAVFPGAEAWSAPGGPHGALVLHGFTGSPGSMLGLAEAFAAAGFAVELPRLPGHGTTVDDMITTGWDDWAATALAAYDDLAARTDSVVVAGLSMGGALTALVAARRPGVAGVVCVNPAIEVGDAVADFARDQLKDGTDRIPAIGGDIADPDATEPAYDAAPLAPLVSFHEGTVELRPELAGITCPVLIMTSPQDHVVPPANSDALAEAVSGPVERVTLERSYHVATLDHDKELIEELAVAFARRAVGAAG
jgi:carboxylesterase